MGRRLTRLGTNGFDVKISVATSATSATSPTSTSQVNPKYTNTVGMTQIIDAEMKENRLERDGVTSTDENNYLAMPSQPGATSQNTGGELVLGHMHGDVNDDGHEIGHVTGHVAPILMSGDENNFAANFNPPHMGYQNRDGRFSPVTSMSGDAYEMNMYNSIIASIEANKKQTNIMQEGYTNKTWMA